MYMRSLLSLLLSHSLILPTAAQDVVTTITHTQATTTIISSPSLAPPSPQYTDTSKLQSATLNATNTYRHQHNASALVWNDTLAHYAQDHVKSCKFAHTGGPYGENLAQGYPDMTSSIDGWGRERKDYDYDKGNFAKDTGHFTQLVWKNSTDLGCGVRDCGKKGWLVCCEYWPQGNVMGHFKEQVQKQVNSDVNIDGSKTSSPKSGAKMSDARDTLVFQSWYLPFLFLGPLLLLMTALVTI